MEEVKVHVYIEGRVQGVFFRASTREEARLLGLRGWVKNCWDGRVEAVFEGESQKVEDVLKWCNKGPAGALVTKVNVNREQPTNEFDTFSIK
jgi:acylphosphatase